MKCPKCGSENCNVQVVTETKLKQKRHGVLYWIFVGWWLQPMLWLFLTLPMLIITIFRPKKYKMKSKSRTVVVCNNCGNTWNV